MGRNRLYSDKELLRKLKEKTIKLGHLPTEREINLDPDLPSSTTYWRRIGDKKILKETLDVSWAMVKKINLLCRDCIYEPDKCNNDPRECLKEAELYFANIDI